MIHIERLPSSNVRPQRVMKNAQKAPCAFYFTV